MMFDYEVFLELADAFSSKSAKDDFDVIWQGYGTNGTKSKRMVHGGIT